ncbi:MAG: DUF2188 domain-containing protein [Clostridia bacterium]|nr:DUF2188 domain-containing protein [Clostridia bacterium]
MATVKGKEDKTVKKATATKKAVNKDEKPVAEPVKKAPEKAAAPKKEQAKKYHIAQRNDDNMWQVKAEGAEKALKLFKTQQEAIDYAKKVAGNQDGFIVIHKKDGSFRKLTY